MVLLGALGLMSCGGTGSTAATGSESVMGDLPAGGEPAEGGIAEVPNPSAEMAAKSGKPLAALQRGHVVFMLKCGECHRYQQPKDLDVDEWEETLPKMIGHAGLESADEKAVLDYVIGVKKLQGQ